MNYVLTEDQRAFQESLARFLAERSDSLFLHRIADQQAGWQDELSQLWRDFSDLGFAGLLVPAAFGGSELEVFDAALLAETLGAAATPLPYLGHQLCCLALTMAGSAEQKAQWLPALASGEIVGSVALNSNGGWTPADWTLSAGSSVEGQLKFVPLPGHTQAVLTVVGLLGGGLGLIAPNASGLSYEQQPCIDLTRFIGEATLSGVSVEALPDGEAHAQTVINAGLALLTADAWGGASRCLEAATEYAKLREQFGVPIGQFQAVKHQLATIALDVEPNRALCWSAAQAPVDGTREAALVKAHMSDAFLRTARATVEVHGGFGYTWEADVHLYLKRAMFDQAFFGNSVTLRRRAALAA